MSERTHKRLNVLVVVYSAASIRNKKPLNNISVPFIHSLWWEKPFHVLFPAFAFAIVCDDTHTVPAYSHILLNGIPARLGSV